MLPTQIAHYSENLLNKIGISFDKIETNTTTEYSFQFILHDACHWILEGHRPFLNKKKAHYYSSEYINNIVTMYGYLQLFTKEEANQKEKNALIYETFYTRERLDFTEEDIKHYLDGKIVDDYKKRLEFNEKQSLIEEIWNSSSNIDHSVISKIENIFLNWSKDHSIKFLNEKEFVI